MLFTESFITDAGKTLLARAAAQEGKIIWTRAATSSLNSDSYTTAQMNALDESSFGTKTSSGVVTAAIVRDPGDTAAIYSEVTNEYYDGEARTFGAWGKIEGDQDDVLVVVARCGSGVIPTTINPSSAGVVKAFIDFELDISAEQALSVQVSEGWYAAQSALQEEVEAREDLEERAVTTHAAGNPSQGEQQHIYGRKIFHNDVSVYSEISARVISSRRSGGGPLLTINPDDGDYGTFNTTMRVNFNALTLSDYNTGDVYLSIDLTDTSQSTDLTVNAHANFTAGITGNVTGNLTGNVTGNVTGNLTGNVTGNVTGNLTGNVTGNVTGNLTGLIPRPDVGTTSAPPIGSIFLAHLTAISGTSPMDVGMSVNTNTYNIRRAKFTVDSDGSVKASSESFIGSIGTGTYTLMSGINGLNSGDSTIALVIRTS